MRVPGVSDTAAGEASAIISSSSSPVTRGITGACDRCWEARAWRRNSLSGVLLVTHRLQPGGRRVDVHRDVRALAPRSSAVPVAFARSSDLSVAGFEIVVVPTLHLNTHSSLDNEEPLRAGVLVPVRSSTVVERHPIHANRDAGLVMGETLDGRLTDEGRRIDGTHRRVARSKEAQSCVRLLRTRRLRCHMDQRTGVGVFNHPQRTVGSFCDIADTLSHTPTLGGLGAALSIEDDAVERLCPHAADESVAVPLRERLST